MVRTACFHSVIEGFNDRSLNVRALIPVSSFDKDNLVSIVLYYGRNNFVGETTIDLSSLLCDDETELESTVIFRRACNA